jgi:hypothetical protein
MEEKERIEEFFLKIFIKRVILDYYRKNFTKKDVDIQKIKQNIVFYDSFGDKNKIIDDKPGFSKSISEGQSKSSDANFIPLPASPLLTKKADIAQKILQRPLIKQIRRPIVQPYPKLRPVPRLNPINTQQNTKIPVKKMGNQSDELMPSITQQKTEIGYSKIDSILADPKVQTVECPGPNKQILIYKGGMIQTANFSLSSEEIKTVMKDISEKTRIPVMSGVFKAAFGELIVTAVISEFVGTRFILQKKQPSASSNPQG